MSNTGIDHHRRPMPRAWLAAAVVMVIAIGVFATMAIKRPRAGGTLPAPVAGLTIALVVEPFEVDDAVPGTWDSPAFAESLAIRLSSVPGLRATANTRDAAFHYSLRGNVTMKEGRLILATRLGRIAPQDTIWSATFWRSASSSTTLLSDLTAAVAEAAINSRVRESLAPKPEKK